MKIEPHTRQSNSCTFAPTVPQQLYLLLKRLPSTDLVVSSRRELGQAEVAAVHISFEPSGDCPLPVMLTYTECWAVHKEKEKRNEYGY